MVDLQTTISNKKEPSYSIKFICPVCKSEKEVLISKAELSKTKSLTSVAIPKDFMCLHSFSAFVDKNGMVRGYQKNDLEIISYADEEKEHKKRYKHLDSKRTLLKLKIHLGEEIFLRCIKSILNDIPICCITNNPIVKDNFRNFVYQIFEENTPPLFITSLEEYNQELRKQFQDRDDIFIFNTSLCIVNKDPFDLEFNEEDFELENYIFNSADFNQGEDSQIIESFRTKVSKLFSVLKEIKNHINSGKIKNKKKILKILKNLTGTKFTNKDILDNIMLNRYDIDINKKFLNGFFGKL